ncbi:hypothetical protein GAYE_SCF00G1818 [Galdieria yellowstonensis]|uniref:Uncharacterized protein n=1 Tax=Galdieria yellowstonensis TaxID=3028027 RepID=A0AAV9I923_9RHOD|nr:hypothetical protein GAYE_SCF00G1818 [Galdieria yellowstonensis]
MKHTTAVRLPFKQPRRVEQPTEAFFKSDKFAEEFDRKISTEQSDAYKASCVGNLHSPSSLHASRPPLQQTSIRRTMTQGEFSCLTNSYKVKEEEKVLDYIEDQSCSLPIEPLDSSSLWEEEWLGDADDFELLEIINLRSAKESAA